LLGGSAIPRTLIEQSLTLSLNLYLSYGLTEMSSQVATGKVTEAGKSCVKILPYRQLRISDEGEILVKGEVLFKGYVTGTKLHLPFCDVIASGAKQSPNSGWFATGDMGQIDPQGCLTVTGRRDNMFISGGENIHPEEIEKALLGIKGITEAVVVPKQDNEFGHRPMAFIKYGGEPLPEDYLVKCLQADLPRFKIPTAFHPWPEHLVSQGIKISRQDFLNSLARCFIPPP
jgi:O-succinylbenzoic acid--CoA ligase